MGVLTLYHHYVNEVRDERTNDWLFAHSPLPWFLFSCLYLYYVLRCGPKHMKDRPAYSFKNLIQAYNILQIVSNAILVYRVLRTNWYRDAWIYCIPFSYSNDPESMEVASIIWWYMIMKMIDYIETVMFVLRKKNNQVSFLHVYHHIGTYFIAWLGVKYFSGYPAIFAIFLNSIVHVIMYSYYLLSTCGPQMAKLVHRVKPFITIIQMVQLTLIILHSAQSYLPSCNVSSTLGTATLIHVGINLLLFYNFYRQAYLKPKKQQ